MSLSEFNFLIWLMFKKVIKSKFHSLSLVTPAFLCVSSGWSWSFPVFPV